MMKARAVAAYAIVLPVILLCSLPLAAQEPAHRAVAFGISARLGDLARLPQPVQYGFHEANPVHRIPKRSFGQVSDRVEQNSIVNPAADFTIGANFLGVGNGFPDYSVPDAPPDTNMAVGDTQIVQWVNVSYTVCEKTSPYTCGPAIAGNALWSGLPGNSLCKAHNNGDPIAQWDVKAHRWLLTQNVFAQPYAVCVAISTSPDANGTYFVYEYSVPGNGFPDYPKWGVWPTNYGQAVNNFGPGGNTFQGPQVCIYNRKKMLAGDPTAEQICHQYSNIEDGLLPADQDSNANPPAGQDQFFIGSVGDVDNAHLSLYSVHLKNPKKWANGAVFTGDGNSQLISISPFNPACGNYGGSCVPQKGVTDLVDSLGGRLMYRLVYWKGKKRQHWLTNLDVAASGGQNGVRWMEFTAPASKVHVGNLRVHQEGTYAPDGNWRWMGSIARDKAGNILVGYSQSCGDSCPGGTPMYPSIFFAGRKAGDPLGTLGTEVPVVMGTGSQPDTSNRWGDYSSMRIDQDGCTFWYTTEFYKVTQSFDWSTQIASAKFANCK